jgi:5-methylcytosine-specific restriction enzyme subunit McrC
MAIPINLFEFEKYSWLESVELMKIKDSSSFTDNLEKALENTWKNRNDFKDISEAASKSVQRFIEFGRTDIIPQNWIGTIYFKNKGEEFVVNLLPKIFYKKGHDYSSSEIDCILAHIIWWISVSENKDYSSLKTDAAALDSNILEVFIWMFSSFTVDVFSSGTYSYYNRVDDELATVRGQINFNKYVQNYATGNRQKIACSFDNFQIDNQFNKIVKYVSLILIDLTKNKASQKNLEEILYILDEVDYTLVSALDCDKVVLNPIYSEFQVILDYCRMFLSSMSAYKYNEEFYVHTLLFESERLFENLIYSTLKRNPPFPVISVSRQRPKAKRLYLVREMPSSANRYQMRNDIVLSISGGANIIMDTKYKKIFSSRNMNDDMVDPVYKIARSDIYQMVAYAIGSGISDIGLIYPTLPFETEVRNLPIYEIFDEFTESTIIRIYPIKVTITHENVFAIDLSLSLEKNFNNAYNNLIKELSNAVRLITREL